MKTYNENCGLSELEWEFEQLSDAVKKEPSTLMCIKILENGFNKLNKPAVSKCGDVERKAAVCDHPRIKRIYVGDGYIKCTICGETFK